MSLTQSARRNHAIYEALPPAYRDAIDAAYTGVAHALGCVSLLASGDDRAEECVSAITAYVIASNPKDAAIKAAIEEVDAP